MVCWLAPARSRICIPERSCRAAQNCSRPWLLRVSNSVRLSSERTLALVLAGTGASGEGRATLRRGGRSYGLRLWRRSRRGYGTLRADDIDIALEIGSILDHDARRADVAHQFGI